MHRGNQRWRAPRWRWVAAACLSCALLGWPPSAHAQPPSVEAAAGQGEEPQGEDESAQAAAQAQAASEAEMGAADQEARDHFRLGKTFYESGRFREAGEEFQRAYALSKRPQLLYNVYVAFRDAHDLPKAIEALRAYLEEVPEAPDRINLKARLASMEQALAQQKAATEAVAPADEPEPATRTELVRSKVPYVLLGVGGAMVLTSAITGGLTLSRTNELDGDAGTTQADIDSARALAISTDVLLFSGLATAATGLVLMLTGVLDAEREVPVAAGCGVDGCGVSFRGRF